MSDPDAERMEYLEAVVTTYKRDAALTNKNAERERNAETGDGDGDGPSLEKLREDRASTEED